MKIRNLLAEGIAPENSANVHGLGIVEVLSQFDGELPAISMLEEAIEKGEVRVGEVSQAGQVPFLTVENTGKDPVLILEGEELVGGKQNRIVNASILVPGGSIVQIPVSCVESGRWDDRTYVFDTGKAIFPAKSRAVQKESVTSNLREKGIFLSDQNAVWDEVRGSLNALGIRSETSDFRVGRQKVAHRIEEFVAAIRPAEKQIGAIFFSRDGILGCELLATPELFRKCLGKIVRSFAFDVLSLENFEQNSDDDPSKWWEDVLNAEFTAHRSPGDGLDIRVHDEGLIGSGLRWKDVLIHLSCFPSMDSTRKGHPSSNSRAAVTERRRRMAGS